MIAFPTFEEVREIPADQFSATCGYCDQPVDAVALVMISPGEEQRLELDAFGMILPAIFTDIVRIVLCVGPCGHSSVDTKWEPVYYVTVN